jgi:hypothetical protein
MKGGEVFTLVIIGVVTAIATIALLSQTSAGRNFLFRQV